MWKFYTVANDPAKRFNACMYSALEPQQVGAVLTISFACSIVIKSLELSY